MSDIKIIALGGVRENAKNLYVVEVNDSIFVLDAGLRYPETSNLVWMKLFQTLIIWSKIKTFKDFPNTRHADAIGAFHTFSEFKAPVFGSPLTIELAKLLLKNTNVKNSIISMLLMLKQRLNFRCNYFILKTTHSVPESLGIVVGTDEETLFTLWLQIWPSARKY